MVRTVHVLLLSLALGCGGETESPPTAPAAPAAPVAPTEAPAPPASPVTPAPTAPTAGESPTAVAPTEAPATAPVIPFAAPEPGTNTSPRAPSTPPSTPPEGADPILGAIEPTPDTVTLGPEVTIGETRFVLYTVDLARVAVAALRAREHGDELEDALDDLVSECAESPREHVDCVRRYAPDVALVLADYTSPTGIGIAAIENGAVTARRSLVVGAEPSPGFALSSGDLDGDGSPELIAELDVVFETDNGVATDGEAPTQASGTLVYFLDRDLGTRFRFASRVESNIDGAFVGCTNQYELVDTNGDGRLDLHLDQSCEHPDGDDPPAVHGMACIGAGGGFECPPVGTFFFDPASPYFAETMDELRARNRTVGRQFSEVEARARREASE